MKEVDPWSLEGFVLARFERLKDLATETVISERQAHKVLGSTEKAYSPTVFS
ncbi:hypothetical protein [Endozoicomonas sp. ALB115]|uniref:hypothetical protein n=1 Tax=Endozoicomonas sp. ALB115 TaxID=3403074 RepID=UPI003BB4A7E8